ncbi:FAD-dependent monooxygenase [Streptomyces sp. NPDC056835]|uniref:aromatic-ring hydroxylase C-terminal domain-containing protein n=1 Tax=Streptomyces sp. NPDC056835 TaxID=3345956 RepID=UPI0036C25482
MSRYQFQDRRAERYREGRVLPAGDAAHQFPATGVALNAILIRPDARIAWATPVGESSDILLPALRQALSAWFGAPRTNEGPHHQPATDRLPTTHTP